MTAEQMVAALIDNLDHEDRDAGWSSITVVIEFDGDRPCGTYGYLYCEVGSPIAVSVRPRLVAPQVRAYLAGHHGPDDALPVKMLVQYDRRTGRYEVTFEDTDRTRWQVTPVNIDTVREELRPRLRVENEC